MATRQQSSFPEEAKDSHQRQRQHKHLQMQDDADTPPPAPPSRVKVVGSPQDQSGEQPHLERVQRKLSVGLRPTARLSATSREGPSDQYQGSTVQRSSQADGFRRTASPPAKVGQNKFVQRSHGRRENRRLGEQGTSGKANDAKRSPLALAGSVYEESSQRRDNDDSGDERQSARVQPGAVPIAGADDEEYANTHASPSAITNNVSPNTEAEITNIVTSARLVDTDQERMQIEAELRQTIQNELAESGDGHQIPTVAAAVLPDEEKTKKKNWGRLVVFGVILAAVIVAVSLAVTLNRPSPNSQPTILPPTPSPTTVTPSLPPVTLRQIGQDLVDSNTEDAEFGKCLALSAKGETVAVCGDGKVVVFRRSKKAFAGDSWNQVGQTLNVTDSLGALSLFVTALSLSGDGTLLAVARGGSVDNVQVYRLKEVAVGNATDDFTETSLMWTPLGDQLVGNRDFDDFGESVALSRDGTTLAVGARDLNEGPGYVRIYHFDETSQQFRPNGNEIRGVQNLDEFGSSVALSEDGTILLVGAAQVRSSERETAVPGYVWAFRSEQSPFGRYVPFGQQIIGEITGDIANTGFGSSVALSADGTILAAGGPRHDGNGNDAGYAQTFRFVDNNWVPLGGSILGEGHDGVGIGFGQSVALSSDGMTLAVGDFNGELMAGSNNSGTTDGVRSGVATLFHFDDSSTEWAVVAAVYGQNVALSSDGTVLATGDNFYTSAVQVYEVVP